MIQKNNSKYTDMSKPAARLGDMHTCPMVTGTVPHVGGPISGPCVPTVLIGGSPAAVVGDMCVCTGPPDTIVKGSSGVFIGGKPAARMGDTTAHGGIIIQGLPSVLIGEVSRIISISAKIAVSGKPVSTSENIFEGYDAKSYNITEEDFKKDVLPALDAAEKMIDEKLGQLEKWDDSTKECFKKAFGDHGVNLDSQKDQKIKQMKKMKELYAELRKNKENKFKFAKVYEHGTDKETQGYFAWVAPGDTSHNVTLSEAYNNAPLTGTDSKAGTMIHELSHFSDVAGTDDHAYGLEEAKNLAKKNKTKAATNADNFEYYVEGAFGC